MKQIVFGLSMLLAVQAAASDVVVSNAWAKATFPGQPVSGAYFDIRAATDAKLISVATDMAGASEIHEMSMNGNLMSMHAVQKVALPAGKTVSLKPGGYHVMLMSLKSALKAGQKLPLRITVQQAGKTEVLKVDADIRAMTAN